MKPGRNARGNAMLITMIALAVLMVLVVGALRFTGSNREGAAAKNKGDITKSCVDAARRLLLSKLPPPDQSAGLLQIDQALPDHSTPALRSRILTGHVGGTGPTATIVALRANTMGQSRNNVPDVANKMIKSPQGSYYRAVATCRDPASLRDTEVEFTFRHGI